MSSFLIITVLLTTVPPTVTRTYDYGLNKHMPTSEITFETKVERSLSKMGDSHKKPRKLHGVSTAEDTVDTLDTVLGLEKNFGVNDQGKKQKKRRTSKNIVHVERAMRPMNEFEQELARQIEEDQLKFVEDEKNPMKYVVEHGILYKQSRFSPLARVEVPEIFQPSIDKPKKRKKSSKRKKAEFRTGVFRGTMNEPLAKAFAATPPVSFPISTENLQPGCDINRFGFICCDPQLESLMLKSYEKLTRKQENTDLKKVAATLRQDVRSFFQKNFETIVAVSDFGTSIKTDFSCKVSIGHTNMVAMAFLPTFDAEEAVTTRRRKRIPYHELTRDDVYNSAELVVSRNGILVEEV